MRFNECRRRVHVVIEKKDQWRCRLLDASVTRCSRTLAALLDEVKLIRQFRTDSRDNFRCFVGAAVRHENYFVRAGRNRLCRERPKCRGQELASVMRWHHNTDAQRRHAGSFPGIYARPHSRSVLRVFRYAPYAANTPLISETLYRSGAA